MRRRLPDCRPHGELRYCPHHECYDRDGHWEGCLHDDDDHRGETWAG